MNNLIKYVRQRAPNPLQSPNAETASYTTLEDTVSVAAGSSANLNAGYSSLGNSQPAQDADNSGQLPEGTSKIRLEVVIITVKQARAKEHDNNFSRNVHDR